jgi:hypothetical protein
MKSRVRQEYGLESMYQFHLFRVSRYDGVIPSGGEWLIGSIVAAGTLLMAWYLFTSKSKVFGYYV